MGPPGRGMGGPPGGMQEEARLLAAEEAARVAAARVADRAALKAEEVEVASSVPYGYRSRGSLPRPRRPRRRG
eukprot:scaffold23046_cov72-Phaeocystis_antarctica.AAC.2